MDPKRYRYHQLLRLQKLQSGICSSAFWYSIFLTHTSVVHWTESYRVLRFRYSVRNIRRKFLPMLRQFRNNRRARYSLATSRYLSVLYIKRDSVFQSFRERYRSVLLNSYRTFFATDFQNCGWSWCIPSPKRPKPTIKTTNKQTIPKEREREGTTGSK